MLEEGLRKPVDTLGDDGLVSFFLAYTGLRWGEMAALRVKSLDLESRRIEVAEAVSTPRGKIIWGTPKSHERRSVPFPKILAEQLVKQCVGKSPEDLVFQGRDGGIMRSGNFRTRSWLPALDALSRSDFAIPAMTMHDLRHTAASLAISAGANVKAVQQMLGHRSAAMTLDVYADLFEDDLDAVAVALNGGAVSALVGELWSEDEKSRSSTSPTE